MKWVSYKFPPNFIWSLSIFTAFSWVDNQMTVLSLHSLASTIFFSLVCTDTRSLLPVTYSYTFSASWVSPFRTMYSTPEIFNSPPSAVCVLVFCIWIIIYIFSFTSIVIIIISTVSILIIYAMLIFYLIWILIYLDVHVWITLLIVIICVNRVLYIILIVNHITWSPLKNWESIGHRELILILK